MVHAYSRQALSRRPQRRPHSPIRTRRMGSCRDSRSLGLATDLLHHGHKVRGVADGPTCWAGLHSEAPPWDRPLACRVKKTTGSNHKAVTSSIAIVRPTNLKVCRHVPRRLAHQPSPAQSLKGISTIAWGCHSAAPATPGHRPPPTTQLGRSCLRNPVGGLTQHRHTGRKRSFSPEEEQEADGRMRRPPAPHPPRAVRVGAFREGEAPSEPVRWVSVGRAPSRWADESCESGFRVLRIVARGRRQISIHASARPLRTVFGRCISPSPTNRHLS
jgi:hypothetical protein